ncbi:MAG TPA: TadE/TadG family type IV pilus assembly protein [Symbiobacteriaceae bacterium]|nr:TadE/TadG family type IV pilus assembly protein [Symbiobacteriaceae bacterium]
MTIRRRQEGQAVAEFLVVVPLLLLILMATIGFGHMIFSRMIVVQAANRAARLGAVLYGDSATPRDEAYRRTRDAALSMLSSGLRGTDREVRIHTTGTDVHVTVIYRTDVFVPLLRPWLGDQLQVEHESIYRIERDTT